MDTLYDVYLGNWPHYHHYAGEWVTIKIGKDPHKDVVITESDIELTPPIETETELICHFVMPQGDVHIDYEYRQRYQICPACRKNYEEGEDTCPYCKKELHEYAGEIKDCNDMISDGVLAWGVCVGRFVFKKYGKVVFAITDTPHVGPSDVTVCYQLSRDEYERLLSLSQPHSIPTPSVPSAVTNMFYTRFLCSESAYSKRTKFTLKDVDLSLCEDCE